jgi:hypothetical protein
MHLLTTLSSVPTRRSLLDTDIGPEDTMAQPIRPTTITQQRKSVGRGFFIFDFFFGRMLPNKEGRATST